MSAAKFLVLSLVFVIFCSARSPADPIVGLFDTGVNNNGVSLPDGTTPDPHYTIVSGSLGATASTTTVKTSASGWPVALGMWLGDSSISAWIMPSEAYPGTGADFEGYFDYQTTFALPSDASSVVISANVSVSQLDNVFLNGALVDSPDFRTSIAYVPVSFASSDVVAGTNTLMFQTFNFGGPPGLRVDGIAGTYTAVPEPLCVEMIGFFGLLLRRLRRAGVRCARTD